MAYISVLWNGTDQDIAFKREQAYICMTPIGHDSHEPISYHMMVDMYPSEYGTEFAFGVVKHHHGMGTSETIFDSDVSNRIIPKSYRSLLRKAVFRLADQVVRVCNRDAFYMVTFCDNLPPAALEKYDRLCDIFDACGYESVRSEPVPGKYFWQMTKRP